MLGVVRGLGAGEGEGGLLYTNNLCLVCGNICELDYIQSVISMVTRCYCIKQQQQQQLKIDSVLKCLMLLYTERPKKGKTKELLL